jgi:hypothetical protein
METLYESILSSTNSGKIMVDPMDFDTEDFGAWTGDVYDDIFVKFKKFYGFKVCKPRSSEYNKDGKTLERALNLVLGKEDIKSVKLVLDKNVNKRLEIAYKDGIIYNIPKPYLFDGKWPLILIVRSKYHDHIMMNYFHKDGRYWLPL